MQKTMVLKSTRLPLIFPACLLAMAACSKDSSQPNGAQQVGTLPVDAARSAPAVNQSPDPSSPSDGASEPEPLLPGLNNTDPHSGRLPEGLQALVAKADRVSIESWNPYTDKSLASATVPQKRRKELVGLLQKSLSKERGIARCFEPRHVVTVKQGERTLRMDICFECSRMHITDGNEKITLRLDNKQEPPMDQFFKKLGITKKAKNDDDETMGSELSE